MFWYENYNMLLFWSGGWEVLTDGVASDDELPPPLCTQNGDHHFLHTFSSKQHTQKRVKSTEPPQLCAHRVFLSSSWSSFRKGGGNCNVAAVKMCLQSNQFMSVIVTHRHIHKHAQNSNKNMQLSKQKKHQHKHFSLKWSSASPSLPSILLSFAFSRAFFALKWQWQTWHFINIPQNVGKQKSSTPQQKQNRINSASSGVLMRSVDDSKNHHKSKQKSTTVKERNERILQPLVLSLSGAN